jgi:hypothetical protein
LISGLRAWPYIVPCVLPPVYAIRASTIQTSYNIRRVKVEDLEKKLEDLE